ncbi:DUF1636 domain-containing protein [Gluconobacter sp. Dm-62]|nr:DUF1636 domain-containing protein [Gluconobacter sp. Dm-62]
MQPMTGCSPSNGQEPEGDDRRGLAVHVCVTCGRSGQAEGPSHGQKLHDALQARAMERGIAVHGVQCLAACDHGCTAVVSMPGKWAWLLGHLGPDKASDLLDYLELYAASAKGTVMPSRRPASLADMVLGRIPASLIASQEPS